MTPVRGDVREGGMGMAKKKAKPVEEQMEIETPVIETAKAEPVKTDVMTGKVFNCQKLNVRKEPKANAEILGTIDADTVVMIDEEKSVGDFYKIDIIGEISGFCMKKFIKTP